jgi:hypothetical protein
MPPVEQRASLWAQYVLYVILFVTCSRRLFQIRETCLLKRFDLFADHGEPGHIAPQLIHRVGR